MKIALDLRTNAKENISEKKHVATIRLTHDEYTEVRALLNSNPYSSMDIACQELADRMNGQWGINYPTETIYPCIEKVVKI